MGKNWKQLWILFWRGGGVPKSLQMVTTDMNLKETCSFEDKDLSMTNLGSIVKSRHYFANKGPYSHNYGFSSSHAWMWELNHKEGWELKNWCFWNVVLEKTIESPLDSKEIKPVNPKGNQPWIFFGRTDAEAPIFWPPGGKYWLTGIDPDGGKNWGQEEKEVTEDKMVEWHLWLNGHEFGQTPGDSEGLAKTGVLQSMESRTVGPGLATE